MSDDAKSDGLDILDDIIEQDRVRATAVAELRRALEASGGSATALARKAGVSPSTITRPIKDPRTASLPKWATIVKILEAAGLTPQSYGGPTKVSANFQVVEVVGELRPGVWYEDIDSRTYGEDIVMALDALRPQGSMSAFAVGPEGIPYAPGTRAIVDSGRSPEPGDYVVLRNFDEAGKAETFAALYQVEHGRRVLYKTGVDGRAQRSASKPLAADLPDIGMLIGPVIATLWIKS
ncbi:helix-turn-helix domain-containing protein [Brevundimonas sp.]|uniref:helix-turn-helix domain-containing protein n=1 Tax=Brevundimonas sp. TaxID=1871086 RepID=UPI0035AFB89E